MMIQSVKEESSHLPYRRLSDEDDSDEIRVVIKQNESSKANDVVVYKRRWYMLLLFCGLAVAQAAVWNTWGPISDSAQLVMGWNDGTIAMFANVANFVYLVTMFPMAWVMDAVGLRPAVLTVSLLLFVGTAIRCITADPTILMWMSYICACLEGMAGTVTFGGPALFSAVWFPANQRATSTAIVSMANYMGITTSFLIGPLLVHYIKPHTNDSTNTTIIPDFNITNGTSGVDVVEIQRHEIMRLIYIECGYCGLLFLLCMIYFPSKPPTPPSRTAAIERLDFKKGLKDLIRNKQNWILTLAYALPTGTLGVLVTILNIPFAPDGITQAECGWIGFYLSVFGALLGLVISRFADVFSKHFKVILVTFYTLSAMCLIWLTLLCQHYIPFDRTSLYVSCILGSVLVNGTIPLFYEFASELCYPVSEGVTGGFLTIINNTVGILFLVVLEIPGIGVQWISWALLASVLLGIPMLILTKERYSRLDIDTDTERDNSHNTPDKVN